MGAFKRYINGVRQRLVWRLTKNIGVSHADTNKNIEIKRILISRPNHRLGNLLLITPLVQEVTELFPNAKIDLFVRGGAAPELFKNYDQVSTIIQLPGKPFKNLYKYVRGWIALKKNHYDIAINTVYHSSSGRLSVRMAESSYKCFGDVNEEILTKEHDHLHVAKHPVYSFRNYLRSIGFGDSQKTVQPLNIKLSPEEIANGKKILHAIVPAEQKIISLFTNATGEKCYSESWWEEFYGRLKLEFPDYTFVEVLPVENISKLSFKIPWYYSKDLREIGSVIANTTLFIGADSGMMHLAVSSQTPTVGLFKLTDPDIFGPYGNNSAAIDTNKTNLDDWIKIIKASLVS